MMIEIKSDLQSKNALIKKQSDELQSINALIKEQADELQSINKIFQTYYLCFLHSDLSLRHVGKYKENDKEKFIFFDLGLVEKIENKEEAANKMFINVTNSIEEKKEKEKEKETKTNFNKSYKEIQSTGIKRGKEELDSFQPFATLIKKEQVKSTPPKFHHKNKKEEEEEKEKEEEEEKEEGEEEEEEGEEDKKKTRR
ncbi:hypothetical protein ACTFIZ_006334 [Dictyostelium cf. discoideum]